MRQRACERTTLIKHGSLQERAHPSSVCSTTSLVDFHCLVHYHSPGNVSAYTLALGSKFLSNYFLLSSLLLFVQALYLVVLTSSGVGNPGLVRYKSQKYFAAKTNCIAEGKLICNPCCDPSRQKGLGWLATWTFCVLVICCHSAPGHVSSTKCRPCVNQCCVFCS